MSLKDEDITNDAVPRGQYRRRKVRYKLANRETKGKAVFVSRGLRIQAGKRTSGSYRFVIDVDKEKESSLFRTLNRRLKKLNK